MIQIIQDITVEVAKPNFFQAIVAKQFDSNSRFLKATFMVEINEEKKVGAGRYQSQSRCGVSYLC